MIKKATLLHLRFPFSFFLLPVFLFAWSIYPDVDFLRLLSIFVILHLLVYPASNGYNSYFDKDEDSIGGLKVPPKVDKELYTVSLIMDLVALIWAIWISGYFALCVFVYGAVSKAYSHPLVRLKKMPFIGWLAAGIFQGYFTFITTLIGLYPDQLSLLTEMRVQIPAILSTCLLFGSYPMTQVYQHDEDARRGDLTISRLLGVLGTFHFTAIAFFFSSLGFFFFYRRYESLTDAILFYAALLPVLIFFNSWYLQVRRDRSKANFDKTMMLNLLSAICLNLFFLYQALS